MTVNKIETVQTLIEEMQSEGTHVGSAWEYTNKMNKKKMFAVFPKSQFCDIYQSPCVENPKQIWVGGKFIGDYEYLNRCTKTRTIHERKYKIYDGRLVRRADGVPVPEDMPLFIFLAQDRNALPVMIAYNELCQDLNHKAEVVKSIKDFTEFRNNNPDRMKESEIMQQAIDILSEKSQIRERKYKIEDGRLVKRADGVPVPEDMPLFIFLAQDRNALPVMIFYNGICKDLNHKAEVVKSIKDFIEFRNNHPERMKEPDA